jgi:hypothetical protein
MRNISIGLFDDFEYTIFSRYTQFSALYLIMDSHGRGKPMPCFSRTDAA